jgi:hypothetical protein
MKTRTKFFIGAVAAILTFGTLAATVGRQHQGQCGHHHCTNGSSSQTTDQP